jgi:hypothetical protein
MSDPCGFDVASSPAIAPAILHWSLSAFLRTAERLYLFDLAQFRTQNRVTLLLELL